MKIYIERIKELRLEAKLSLRQLANVLNVSANTISRWERGERVPTADHIIALSKYFGVSSDYILGFTID